MSATNMVILVLVGVSECTRTCPRHLFVHVLITTNGKARE